MSSGDKYARRYDKIIEIPRKTKATDDTILWDSDIGEHWWQVINYLDLVGRKGIIMNTKIFKFCEKEVNFAGFCVTKNKVEPLPKYFNAIHDFPVPIKQTDIRSCTAWSTRSPTMPSLGS